MTPGCILSVIFVQVTGLQKSGSNTISVASNYGRTLAGLHINLYGTIHKIKPTNAPKLKIHFYVKFVINLTCFDPSLPSSESY